MGGDREREKVKTEKTSTHVCVCEFVCARVSLNSQREKEGNTFLAFHQVGWIRGSHGQASAKEGVR